MTFQNQVARRVEVAEALRHLLTFHEQKAHVHPISRESLAGCSLRLRNLVFVMRKNQIFTAKVYIESVAKVFHCHRRALDVPARTARANLGLPRCFAWLR